MRGLKRALPRHPLGVIGVLLVCVLNAVHPVSAGDGNDRGLRVVMYGPKALGVGDRAYYPTVVSDARRALYEVSKTDFAPYHICDVDPHRQPIYCATGRPVEGYWEDSRTYVVVLLSHQAVIRQKWPRPPNFILTAH